LGRFHQHDPQDFLGGQGPRFQEPTAEKLSGQQAADDARVQKAVAIPLPGAKRRKSTLIVQRFQSIEPNPPNEGHQPQG
jgi:hypothetical protein